jgi:hypothetical protein
MTISPSHVNRCRGWVLWALRIIAVSLVAVGVYLCLKRIFLAVGTGSWSMATQVWEGAGETASFYRGTAMLVVGGAMAGLSRRVSRWIIAMPPDGCPRCGHPRSPGALRCQECGLRWENGGAA